MVTIIHAPPQEIVVTGLTGFSSQQNLASMIAFVMNVSGQPMALYWAEGVVFLADFVEPEALPDEYVKGKIYASNVSHAPMAKYSNMIRVGNMEVDRKSTRLNSSHMSISYAVFCLKKKKI